MELQINNITNITTKNKEKTNDILNQAKDQDLVTNHRTFTSNTKRKRVPTMKKLTLEPSQVEETEETEETKAPNIELVDKDVEIHGQKNKKKRKI